MNDIYSTLLTVNYQDVHSYKCALFCEFHVQDITHDPSSSTMRFVLLSVLNADQSPQGNSYASGLLL